jgi:hypothetical protein
MTTQASRRKYFTLARRERRFKGSTCLRVNGAIVGIEEADKLIPGVTRLVMTDLAILCRNRTGHMRAVSLELRRYDWPRGTVGRLRRRVAARAGAAVRFEIVVMSVAGSAVNLGPTTTRIRRTVVTLICAGGIAAPMIIRQ